MRMNMETFDEALDFRYFLKFFFSGVNIWYRGRHILDH